MPQPPSNPFDHHPQPRMPFTFTDRTADGIPASMEERQVRAAEYIAMYLDRIDIQLGRIAVALETGAASDGIRAQLQNLATMLPNLLTRR
jgi:hypothetical protein